MKSNEGLESVKSPKKSSSAEATRRIVLIALFGVVVFISKTFLPSPIVHMVVVVQAMFLALGSLLLWPFGATLVAIVGGTLTIFLRPLLAPFTLVFALIYGLLTDGFIHIFRVKFSQGDVKAKRLVAAVTMSTAITGMASYYTTVHVLALLPREPVLETIILVGGVVNGLLGACLAVLI